MPDAKRTKRVRDASEEMTLEEHIAAKRASLLADREAAPQLRERARALRDEAAGMGARWQHRRAADLCDQADALDREATERESMAREHHFESVVVGYLRTYHQRVDAVPTATLATRKSDAIEAYVKHTDLTG